MPRYVGLPLPTCRFPSPKKFVLILAKQWGLVAGALVIAAPVIFLRIKDTVSLEEDLKFSDETVEDVAPARDVAVLNKEAAV